MLLPDLRMPFHKLRVNERWVKVRVSKALPAQPTSVAPPMGL